jgi:heme a synthase
VVQPVGTRLAVEAWASNMNHSDALALVDLAPVARLLMLALALAALPMAWLWLRQRGSDTPTRLAALAALTLFLTFDLIVFGAFTRLSDSGLGCPDWPGCYGQATPLGARADIHAAQSAAPGGPVTWSKAWIEMIHRYLAMTVGVLILVMAVVSWLVKKRLPFSPWLPTFTLLWVMVQGLFGKYTVTLKLYPAVVTLHLLGGLFLLALLALQHVAFRPQPVELPPKLRWLLGMALLVVAVQVTLGGWVSTNYAVLACTGFPQCNSQWWPEMDWSGAFTVLRGLGETGPNGAKTLTTLVTIHMAHRIGAVVACTALLALAWGLWSHRRTEPAVGPFALVIFILLLAQVASGLSNVVLGWPLLAALGHSAGAAALVLVLALLWARARLSAKPFAAPVFERGWPA